jgi:hypothetical protein
MKFNYVKKHPATAYFILTFLISWSVSTGCLVTFGAARITPAQEALWYGVYALLLWIVVMTLLRMKKDIAFRTSQ